MAYIVEKMTKNYSKLYCFLVASFISICVPILLLTNVYRFTHVDIHLQTRLRLTHGSGGKSKQKLFHSDFHDDGGKF